MAAAYPDEEPDVPELDHENLSRLEKMYPDNLIWRWADEPVMVMENGDKLYGACIRPKEEGDYDAGGSETSAVRDKEGLVEVGECCAFKYATYDPQPVGLITRLSEKAKSQGLLCSKFVTYKPFVKLTLMPAVGTNYSKTTLLKTASAMNLNENYVLLLCSHESETFLQDIIFPVAVVNVYLYQQYWIPTTVNPSTDDDQAAEDEVKPNYCCLGLYDMMKNRVKLMLDEDFCLKDYLVPELTEEMLMVDRLMEENALAGLVMDEWVDDDDEEEENGVEENVVEENVVEENVEEENVVEENALAGLVMDEWVDDDDEEEENVVEENVVEENVVDENVVEENVSEENVSEENVSGENVSEENVSEENVSEENVGDKLVEEKLVEEKLVEEKLVEEKLVEERVAEERVAEERVAEERVAEERVAEEKVAEEKVAEEKVAEEKVAEEKVAEEKVVEEKVAEEKVAEEKVVEEKIPLGSGQLPPQTTL